MSPRYGEIDMPLHRVGRAHLEGSTYEGTYRGQRVKVERSTDPNDDGPYYGKSATCTVWRGWVWDPTIRSRKPGETEWRVTGDWSCVVEEAKTKHATVFQLADAINFQLEVAEEEAS